MSSTADEDAVIDAVLAATEPRADSIESLPARFALELRPRQDPVVIAADVVRVLADLGARVSPLSALDPEVLVLDLLDRALAAARPAACFAAGYALADRFDLVGAEPDLPTAFFPEQGALPADASPGGALSGFPPGCYVDPEPALEPTPDWAIDAMHVPAAWAFSERSGTPSRGEDVVVAQPDTGITPHVELVGVAFVPGFDVIDDDTDPTDPMTESRQPRARHRDGQCPGVAGRATSSPAPHPRPGSCRSARSRAWCGSGRSRSPARSTGRSRKEPTSSP